MLFGSEGQRLAVDIDTGSADLWVNPLLSYTIFYAQSSAVVTDTKRIRSLPTAVRAPTPHQTGPSSDHSSIRLIVRPIKMPTNPTRLLTYVSSHCIPYPIYYPPVDFSSHLTAIRPPQRPPLTRHSLHGRFHHPEPHPRHRLHSARRRPRLHTR